MSAENIAHTVATAQGWTDATLLSLCETYVSNQQADDAFTDFLRTVAADENEGTDATIEGLATADDLATAQGWTDTTLLDLHLTYIDRQGSNDAFEEHLRTVADEENGGPSKCLICGGPMVQIDFGGSYCEADCTEPDDADDTCVVDGCDATLTDGEGYDGCCGTHADLIAAHEAREHVTAPNPDCPDCPEVPAAETGATSPENEPS